MGLMSSTDSLVEWLVESSESEGKVRLTDFPTLRLILEKTIGDDRLSHSEKLVLRDLIWDQKPDETRLAVLRRAAFDLVAERIDDSDQRERLEWLHDLVELLTPRREPAGKVRETHPQVLFSPRDACAERICAMIQGSEQKMDLCVFTITDNRLTEAVVKAHQRGLKVRLITDDLKSEDLGSDIEQIAASGVPVKVDRSPFHMHHKFAIFDEKTVITGSYNWTRNAANENQENILVTHDERIVRPFSGEFERLWARLEPL